MKREDLFESAIVLARQSSNKRRVRCEVVETRCMAYPNMNFAEVRRLDSGLVFYASIKDMRPAKITRNSLKECGFIESYCYACDNKCLLCKGTNVRLLLKGCLYNHKSGNELLVPWKHKPVRYMHEVQREVSKRDLTTTSQEQR